MNEHEHEGKTAKSASPNQRREPEPSRDATVWKFPIIAHDVQTISVPRGAKYLTAQMQRDTITLWALVDPTAPAERHTIRVVGTGNPVQPDALTGMRYLATVQEGGWPGYVWHVFVPEGAP